MCVYYIYINIYAYIYIYICIHILLVIIIVSPLLSRTCASDRIARRPLLARQPARLACRRFVLIQEFPGRDSKPKKRLQENTAIPCVLLSWMCISIALFSRSLFLGLESLLANLGILRLPPATISLPRPLDRPVFSSMAQSMLAQRMIALSETAAEQTGPASFSARDHVSSRLMHGESAQYESARLRILGQKTSQTSLRVG